MRAIECGRDYANVEAADTQEIEVVLSGWSVIRKTHESRISYSGLVAGAFAERYTDTHLSLITACLTVYRVRP